MTLQNKEFGANVDKLINLDLEVEYSREARGEMALNKALERGRKMRDSAMEKAAPLLVNLRSRISSFATRAMSVLKTSLGVAGEMKDAGIKLGDSVGDMMIATPQIPVEIAKHVYGDVVKPVFYDTPMDILNPVDEAAIEDLNNKIDAITLALDLTKNKKSKETMMNERTHLTQKRDTLVNAPQSQRPRVMAVRNAPGQAADAVIGKLDASAEHVMKKERDFLVAGTIAGKALSKILGTELNLSNAQAIALGGSLEAAGLMKAVGEGTMDFLAKSGEVALDLSHVKGMIEVAQGNAQAMKAMYKVLATEEGREWLQRELISLGVEPAKAMVEVVKDLSLAGKKGLKAATKGAAIAGVGAAALVTAPVTIPLAAVGMAGYGAYKGAEAGLSAGAKAINKGFDAIEPEVLARINELVAGAKTDWARVKPGLLSGLDRTVGVVSDLAVNVENAPADVKNLITSGIGELNRIAGEGASLVTRAQERVKAALRVAEQARNEIRLALAGEGRAAKNPKIVAKLTKAHEALQGIDEIFPLNLMNTGKRYVVTPKTLSAAAK